MSMPRHTCCNSIQGTTMLANEICVKHGVQSPTGLFVCLLVCPSDNWKSCGRILTKFLGGVGHAPGTKVINFGDDPDHRPNQWVQSPKSGFAGLSKKYLVDSDQSCIANLHCKNHSEILLCWRSAEVCALWVLPIAHCFKVLGNCITMQVWESKPDQLASGCTAIQTHLLTDWTCDGSAGCGVTY